LNRILKRIWLIDTLNPIYWRRKRLADENDLGEAIDSIELEPKSISAKEAQASLNIA